MPTRRAIEPSDSLKKQKDGARTARRGGAAAPGPEVAAGAERPSAAQRRYLERGLAQPGGKLPLFDEDGREVPARTVAACLEKGWAEPWFANPIKPDWIVARLTAAGYRALGREPPRGERTSAATDA